MTLPGIVTTARTLSYYTRWQEAVANNLANATTAGYKADRMTAQQQVGGQHPVAVHQLDLRQGSLRETGRTLDVGLEGEGFLVVQTPAGERLLRGGGLAIDEAGYLTDRHGHLVLGLEGPLHVAGRELIIESDGTVVVDGARADRLRLVTVEEPTQLQKEGEGRFLADPTTLRPAASVRLRQGTLEDANVDPLLGTVDLIMIQRAYTANLDALRAMDSVLGTITGQLGSR